MRDFTTEDDEREGSSSSEDEEDEADLTWEDWVSDSIEDKPCRSLFENKVFPSVSEALKHDKTTHGFDLDQTCTKLGVWHAHQIPAIF